MPEIIHAMMACDKMHARIPVATCVGRQGSGIKVGGENDRGPRWIPYECRDCEAGRAALAGNPPAPQITLATVSRVPEKRSEVEGKGRKEQVPPPGSGRSSELKWREGGFFDRFVRLLEFKKNDIGYVIGLSPRFLGRLEMRSKARKESRAMKRAAQC